MSPVEWMKQNKRRLTWGQRLTYRGGEYTVQSAESCGYRLSVSWGGAAPTTTLFASDHPIFRDGEMVPVN